MMLEFLEHDYDVSLANPPIIEGCWFRYEDFQWNDGPHISLRQFPVMRTTPCGVWLDVYGDARFCLNNARKRFAYPTLDLARESFLIRKRKQIGYLAAQHDRVTSVLRKAEQVFA